MRNFRLFIIGILTLVLLPVLFLSGPALAAEEEGYIIDVTRYGAVPDDEGDDMPAFNKALEEARVFVQQGGEKPTVLIPAGTYHLSDSIYVYSNTILKAESGAVIYATVPEGPIIAGGHIDPSTGKRCTGGCSDHGFGYSKGENITVEGGTWVADTGASDRNSTIIAFRHSRNITIKNLTCRNASGHMINLSGVDHATVSGVTFKDARPDPSAPDNSFHRECIHLDYCTEEGEPYSGMPYDGTPAKNITVDHCAFNNVYCGVGNHHLTPSGGTVSSDITVKNCTFTDVGSFAVCESSVSGMKVLNNTCKGVPVLLYLTHASDVTVQGNTYDALSKKYEYIEGKEGKDYSAVYVDQSTGVTIDGNQLANSVYAAVKAYSTVASVRSHDITVTGNTITNFAGTGIDLQMGDNDKVMDNTLSEIGNIGIYLRQLKNAEASNNKVSVQNHSAMYIGGTSDDPCTVTVTGNTLNTASEKRDQEHFDLYLSDDCDVEISENILKNNSFYYTKKAKYTADFPELKTLKLKKTTYTYTGSEIKPKVTVKDTAGHTLKEGIHYRVEYVRNVRAGDKGTLARVEGLPRTMYEGQKLEQKFTIKPKKVTPKVVPVTKTYTYDGKEKKPAVKVYVGKKLVDKTYYTVKYERGVRDAGKHYVTVTLKKNYTGTGKGVYTIKAKKLKKFTVKLEADSFRYTGSEIKPYVTVYDGEKKIPKANLKLTYDKDCISVGTHYITVKLIGNYSGSKKVSYKIVARKDKGILLIPAGMKLLAALEADTVRLPLSE